MGRKVAIVTGANRGIGYHVARQLLQQFGGGDVILTARNTAKGKKACQQLITEGLKPIWHELDVTQSASVRMFLDFINDHYGGVDVIVSNAGVIFPKDCLQSVHRQAELTIQTNFKGTLSVLKHLMPLLRPHSRVVILSSELGKMSSLGAELRRSIDIENISTYELELLSDKYLTAVKGNVCSEYGWPGRILETVGVFQNILAYILSRDMRNDPRRNILINAGCPGWTATEQMKTHLDDKCRLGDVEARSPEDAARDITWLALLSSGTLSPKGDVVCKREKINFMDC